MHLERSVRVCLQSGRICKRVARAGVHKKRYDNDFVDVGKTACRTSLRAVVPFVRHQQNNKQKFENFVLIHYGSPYAVSKSVLESALSFFFDYFLQTNSISDFFLS